MNPVGVTQTLQREKEHHGTNGKMKGIFKIGKLFRSMKYVMLSLF